MNKTKILAAAAAMLALAACSQNNREREMQLLKPSPEAHNNWVIEDRSNGESTFVMLAEDTMEVEAADGLTMWYDQKLTGDYQISYTVKMVMQGGTYDRLSDLNCFWAASDPLHPEDIFARSKWRNGLFTNYDTLNLLYVGYGGNHNSTTRFREYHAEHVNNNANNQLRPVIKEYTNAANLLKPNRWMTIRIRVKNDVTTYSVDGKQLFSLKIPEGRGDGYFGLRLLTNHTIIKNFSITEL